MLPGTVFILATLLTFGVGYPVYAFLKRKGVLDRPNERSSHERPTVRGGGVAIMVVVVVGLVVLAVVHSRPEMWGLVAGAFFLAVLSWVDDVRELPSGVRFAGHAIFALLFLASLGFPAMAIAFSEGSAFSLPVVVSVVIGFLWLAGYTNAFNFMDGINGISGVQAGLTGVGMGIFGAMVLGDWAHPAVIASFLVSGAALGFLPHNFPKARMFMGDVSAAPLGFLLAALVFWMAAEAGWWLLVPLAMLHANYVFDTGFTLARRVLRGDDWHSAHREHFYQRLVRSGKSHAYTTICEGALLLITFVLMLVYLYALVPVRLLLVLAACALWAAFYAYCERRFRRLGDGRRADAGAPTAEKLKC